MIVTPYMVRPTARQNWRVPSTASAIRTDRKANSSATSTASTAGGRELPAGDLKGDYGFIVE